MENSEFSPALYWQHLPIGMQELEDLHPQLPWDDRKEITE